MNDTTSQYIKQAFTLVEIMVGVLIFSLVIIGGFKAYSGVLVGKVKLIESTDIQKEAFYFSEKFFEELKRGGTIDYEEYFNRRVVGTATLSGHYSTPTGFGNFGKSGNVGTSTFGDYFYYCRSGNGAGNKMGTGGCFNSSTLATVSGQNGHPQRYRQYGFQFIDYNSNYDGDGGDEDGVGGIRGDDDDEYLGEGPEAFTGSKVEEIYLISADGIRRTLFRWNILQDELDPTTCNTSTFNGCRGTIEFLKLAGVDIGLDHSATSLGGWQYDGLIDTWFIHPDFDPSYPNGVAATLQHTIAGANTTNYRQPLFGDKVSVKDVSFYLYPNKDLRLAWKDSSDSTNISPYIRVQMTLAPSYKARRGIKGKIPEIKINTTISLTDIYSQ